MPFDHFFWFSIADADADAHADADADASQRNATQRNHMKKIKKNKTITSIGYTKDIGYNYDSLQIY